MFFDSSIRKSVAANSERWLELISKQTNRICTNFKVENSALYPCIEFLPIVELDGMVAMIYLIMDDTLDSWFKEYYQSPDRIKQAYAKGIEEALLKNGIQGLGFDNYDEFISHIYPYSRMTGESYDDFSGYHYSPDDSFDDLYYVEILFDPGLDLPRGYDRASYLQRCKVMSTLRDKYRNQQIKAAEHSRFHAEKSILSLPEESLKTHDDEKLCGENELIVMCPHCHRWIPEEHLFCQYCGERQ